METEAQENNVKNIVIKNLAIGYDVPIVNNISLDLSGGLLYSLTGKNGSGKSTLLKTIIGLIKPIAGSIFYGEERIDMLLPKKRKEIISAVFTTTPSRPVIPTWELVALSLDTSLEERKKTAMEALEICRATHLAEIKSNELSDGQFQKIMLARSFAQNTPILIMDEPTSFLDYESKEDIFSLLKQITKERKKTVLVATHDLDMAKKYSDKLLDINNL